MVGEVGPVEAVKSADLVGGVGPVEAGDLLTSREEYSIGLVKSDQVAWPVE
jgi:hypothetical protein